MKQPMRIVVPLFLLAVAATLFWFLGRPNGDEVGLFSSGVVEATQADLGFQLPGRVDVIGPREGDEVQAGQELAALDRAEIEARLSAAASQVSAARALLSEMESGGRPEEIAQAQARLRTAAERVSDADRDLRRARTLHAGGAVSQEALDKAETAHQVALANRSQAADALALVEQGPRREAISAQRAVVHQAEASHAQVEAILAQATIRAPFAGLVTVRHREPGETVGAGMPVLTLRDLGDRWVRIYVRGDAIGRVRVGQAASIVSDTYPDREFEGEVTFISSEAEFTPRNVQTTEERTRLVYAVKVRIIGDSSHVLKPGVPADVRLHEAASAER